MVRPLGTRWSDGYAPCEDNNYCCRWCGLAPARHAASSFACDVCLWNGVAFYWLAVRAGVVGRRAERADVQEWLAWKSQFQSATAAGVLISANNLIEDGHHLGAARRSGGSHDR